MKRTRIAINGFGRIGRAFVRQAWHRPDIEIVAVNDLGSHENLAYLLKYDTIYGRAPFTVEAKNNNLCINGQEVRFVSEKDPTKLPWKELRVDVVVESTGVFTDYEKARAHIDAGARRVVITAPVKNDAGGATVLMSINEEKFGTCDISSNGSCTTNAGSPLIAILDEGVGIELALLNTTHAYTASQSLVDGPVKGSDFQKGRAAAQNIVPESTGAAISITKAYEPLKEKFDGISLRVPVPVGSIADVTFLAKRETSAEEVNSIMKKAAEEDRWKGLFRVSEDPICSSDIIGDTHASIAELSQTRVVGGRLVKVLAWYDNEAGYTHTLVEHVVKAGNA